MLRARPNLPWLLGGILFVLAAGNAQAAENDVVSVEIDHATVFRLAAPAGTIIAKAPTTPKTYNGAAKMGDGELRYWSWCSNQGFANTRVNQCV